MEGSADTDELGNHDLRLHFKAMQELSTGSLATVASSPAVHTLDRCQMISEHLSPG